MHDKGLKCGASHMVFTPPHPITNQRRQAGLKSGSSGSGQSRMKLLEARFKNKLGLVGPSKPNLRREILAIFLWKVLERPFLRKNSYLGLCVKISDDSFSHRPQNNAV